MVEQQRGRRIWRESAFWVLAARLIVGGVFVWLGLLKALDPVTFLKTLRQMDLPVSSTALTAIAALLPWFEIFCGLLLLLGLALRGTAVWLLLLLAAFTVQIAGRAWEIGAAQGIPFCAIQLDCGCGTGEVRVCPKLLQNLGLLLLSGLILVSKNRRFCLGR